MNFKKWICCFVALGAFVIWGGLTPVWAGEAELILNLLKKKNIITQQEADEILTELHATSQQEKAEAKKEIKAEVKEDLAKDASKGDFLPKELKGFKFGGQIFAEWNSVSRSEGLPSNATVSKNLNQFALNRGQFTLAKDFNDWLGMNITADLFYATDTNDTTNGAQLRLKMAYASAKYLGTTTMFGMVPTPSDGYDNSIWAYRVQGKNLLDDLSIMSTYDLGIANQGVIGGYMDDDYLKFASKPYSGKWGGYMIGLYNGAGYTTTTGEGNNNKVISGLLYLRPLPTVPILKGLQLAYSGAYGHSNKLGTLPGQTTSYPDYRVNMVQMSLLHRYFTVMGQYYWGEGTATGTEEKDRIGYLTSASIRSIPGIEKLQAFGKFYHYDADKSIDKNSYNIYVVGLAYDVTPVLMPFIAWERRDNESNVAKGTTNANIDYNKYQIGMQLKF